LQIFKEKERDTETLRSFQEVSKMDFSNDVDETFFPD